MRRLILLSALLALWLGAMLPWASSARASVAAALDLDTLLSRSQAVLVGRTLARDSRWAGGRIVTLVRVQVEQSELGAHAPGEVVTLLRWGGVVGDVGMHRFGEPDYHEGQRHLLFLRSLDGARYRPVGLSQGALAIENRAGVDWLAPKLDGLRLLAPGSKALGQGQAAFGQPEPLDEALRRIRARLGR